jgi:hypothetical protein
MFLFFYIAPSIPTYINPTNPVLEYILPIVSPLMALTGCMVSKQMLGTDTFNELKLLDANVYLTE